MTYGLLNGLRVLELGEFISAPYCAKLLADMGAQVLKIERPTGDWARDYGPYPNDLPHREHSGMFLYLNANKRGITLNLDTPTGREIFANLLSRFDVLVHNIHPTEMARIGLDYQTLCHAPPPSRPKDGLIMASITPFGLTGPYRNWKAYDINLAAGGGICEGLGSPDREPLTFGAPEVGYFAGAAAASSIIMALLANPDGAEQGQHIDIAEIETMAGLYNGPEALMAVYQWRVTRRTGHHALDFPYPNCILRCKDGYIFVGSPEGRQWRRLLELMGNPQWAQDPRFRNRTTINNQYADEADAHLEEWLQQHTKAQLLDLALQHRIPLAPVRGFNEVRNDPSLTTQFTQTPTPNANPETANPNLTSQSAETANPITIPGPPYQLSTPTPTHPGPAEGDAPSEHPETPNPPQPAPTLGQHNTEIYTAELGYTPQEVAQLYRAGII